MRRLERLFRRRKLDRDLEAELRFHIEERARAYVASGMPPEAARRAARLAFGNPAAIREDTRAVWTLGGLESLWQDARYAARTLAKSPRFTVVAVVTMALGIGVNVAMFNLANALWLVPLPVKDPAQLVMFGSGGNWGIITGETGGPFQVFSYPLYQTLRANKGAFQDLCAFQTVDDPLSVRIPGRAGAELGTGKLVSGNYFPLLGIEPVAGRMLEDDDDVAGARPVAVISYRYWTTAFARDPAVVGRVVSINGTGFIIVGVAPARFFGETLEPDPPDFWVPVAMQPQVTRTPSMLAVPAVSWLYIFGRLPSGVSLGRAQAPLTAILRGFLYEQAGPNPSADARREIESARIELTWGASGVSHLRRYYSKPLLALLGIAAAVFLVACTNVANLLLARTAARWREISTRLAIGASRWRLAWQLLAESLLLALAAAAVGVLASLWCGGALAKLAFHDARSLPLSLGANAHVLGFTAATALLAGILFGVLPALRVRQVNLAEALKTGGRTSESRLRGRRRFPLGKALVVAQVALSTILLVAAGLFVRSLQALERQNLGMDRQHLLVAAIDPQTAGYAAERLPKLYGDLERSTRALPGVRGVALATYAPMLGLNWSGPITVAGYAPGPHADLYARWNRVDADYFSALGMPIRLGRGISAEDVAGAARVAVINETFARRFFPERNPLGRRFGFDDDPAHGGDFRIVGVAQDTRFASPREEIPATFFIPFFAMTPNADALRTSVERRSNYARALEVRTAGDPLVLASAVRRAIRSVDPDLPIIRISTFSEQWNDALSQDRLLSDLSAGLGLLALVIAAIGLYGLISYMLVRRTGEIGLRMALGAEAKTVLGMVLREGLGLALAGVVVGLAGAFGVARLLASLLFAVKPSDPETFLAAVLVLLAAALAAGYLPARRSAKVDPMTALRYE